jgi:DNA repair protein RecO (recombination protein O)
VRAVAYGESDVIATFLTAESGRLAAIVRGARKGTKRVGGALEPFHTIEVTLADKGGDLTTLKEARITRVRNGIVSNLEALDAAGSALRWARHLCPPRIKEPAAWDTMIELLDRLDATPTSARPLLAVGALRLLASVGYGLELDQCVRCGKPCPDGRAACIDPERGGIVCVECGGARLRIGADLRTLAQEAQRGGDPVLSLDQANELLSLVAIAMSAHTEMKSQ